MTLTEAAIDKFQLVRGRRLSEHIGIEHLRGVLVERDEWFRAIPCELGWHIPVIGNDEPYDDTRHRR